MEVVVAIVGKVFDCLFDATWRQIGYLYQLKNTSEKLRNQLQNLSYTKERVEAKIDEAASEGNIILTDVKNWMEQVDDISEQVENLLEDEDNIKGSCLKHPLSNYRLCKQAQKKIQAISALLEEEAKLGTVSRKAPPGGAGGLGMIPLSASSINFKSREAITDMIMETLKDEEFSIVGICGMGGVGKTTLVTEIARRVLKKKLYERVVMVVVSQTQNYWNIQEEIAYKLGCILPVNKKEEDRAESLCNYIKEKKSIQKVKDKQDEKNEPELERILIILDDVWEDIQLERVGIPFGETRRGCKIVLTSRSEDVCVGMEAKTFAMGTLPKDESWSFFRHVAGKIVDDDDINPIAKEVADECCGLPIALVTVAGALKNRKSKYDWSDAREQLRKSALHNIKRMDEKVCASLELSYNFLATEDEKSIFLLCCLFPEDFWIPVEMLVRYGQGLRLFQDVDTMEEARYRTHGVVSTLVACFLLISTSTTTPTKHVKMHDVVRDVAIKLCKDKHNIMAKASIGLRGWPRADSYENLVMVSLMNNHLLEVPDGLKYPKLQALLLQQNPELLIADEFFAGMKDLKVLDMSNVRTLPRLASLLPLTNLTTLYLDDCKFDDADIASIGLIRNLEILSLQNSDIEKIPEEFKALVKLGLFDLRGSANLIDVSPYVIMCLRNLEELHVSREGLFIELQDWRLQTSVRIGTPEAGVAYSVGHSILVNRLPLEKPMSFVVQIGFGSITGKHLEKCRSWSKILYFGGISFRHADWSCQVLSNITEVLHLRDIKGLQDIRLDPGSNGFKDLKCLQLSECKEITYLLNAEECTGDTIFNSLESLFLENISNLVEICHGTSPDKFFCKLKNISISSCVSIMSIIPSNLVQKLDSLESFEACNCAAVECIFDLQLLLVTDEETKFLSSLKIIHIEALPELMCICNGDDKFISLCNLKRISVRTCSKLKQVFPAGLVQSLSSLEDVEISGCERLEQVFGKLNAKEPNLVNLSNLTISNCHNLKTLFTVSIAKGLEKLKTLEVRQCRAIEEIVSEEKTEAGTSSEKIIFPSLYQIHLADLMCITCFCGSSCIIELQALELLDIQRFPKLKTFSRGNQATPKLNKINLGSEERRIDNNLNTTLQQLRKESQVYNIMIY